MKVYIQADQRGMPYNINSYSAMRGFEQMGFETVLFSEPEELEEVSKTNIIVGGVGRIKTFLEDKGIVIEDIDYPEELRAFYKRKIWASTVKELLTQKHTPPVFVKPKIGKLFSGFTYFTDRDLIGRVTPSQNVEIYCSEIINIQEEWRCFIRYGKILDIRRYSGDIGLSYDFNLVKHMVEQYAKAPNAYALDIGVTDKGDTIIVEVNDGYSLGSYGLDPLLYAKLLSARWAEMTNTTDECNF